MFELPDVFAEQSAFSFSVRLSLNPGQHFLDSEKSLEMLRDLLEDVPNIYLEKRGQVEDNSLYVEIMWTEKVCDGPFSPLYTRETFLSTELAKRGILISDDSKNTEGEDSEEEVPIRAVVGEDTETLPPTLLTVEPGLVLECCVQAILRWNLVVVHLNNSATRQDLAKICHCMKTFASTFPRVETPR